MRLYLEKFLANARRAVLTMGMMLDERKSLFADVGFGSLEGVELVVAAAHKLLLSFASENLKESPCET